MRRSPDADEHQGPQYWPDPVRCGRYNVRDMEGLAASVLLIAILLGVLLIIGLWVGIRSASNPQPQPPGELNCPTGTIWTPVQKLCEQS
jgi:hypothetical protein